MSDRASDYRRRAARLDDEADKQFERSLTVRNRHTRRSIRFKVSVKREWANTYRRLARLVDLHAVFG